MADLDKNCHEGNRTKIHEAEATENTSRASKLRSLKCDKNFAVQVIYMIITNLLLLSTVLLTVH